MADFFQVGNKPLISVNPYGGKTGKYDRPSTINFYDPNLPDDVRFARNRDREPGNFVTTTLDLLFTRGQYVSAALTDTLLSQGLSSLPVAIENAFSEGIAPQARLSYEDLIKRYTPEFARDNPRATFAIGLAGDILLDPLTYVGIGLFSKAKKVGGLALNKIGTEVFGEILEFEAKRVYLEFGKQTAEDLVRQSSALFFRSNEALMVSRSADAIVANVLKDSGYAANKLTELGLEKYIGETLTQEKGLRFFYGLGKKQIEIPAYKIINPVFEKLGLNELATKVSDLSKFAGVSVANKVIGEKTVDTLGTAYKDFKYNLRGLFIVDDEVKEQLKFYENFLPNIQTGVIRDILSIPTFGKAVDLDVVQKALLEVETIENTTKSVRGFLDINETTAIREKVFKDLGLSADETILAATIFQRNNDIKFIDNGVNLIEQQILNADLATNTVIKSADDLIRFKQMALDGTLPKFVASNADLQNKLYSIESLSKTVGKQVLKYVEGTKPVVYGKQALDISVDSIKKIEGLSDNKAFNLKSTLKEKDGIIEGIGAERDINKIKEYFTNNGFEDIALKVSDNIGVITDGAGKILKQSVFKGKDGSIVRIVQERTNQMINKSTVVNGKKIVGVPEIGNKFSIIKTVSAPNEAFVASFIGDTKIMELGINTLKATSKRVNGVIVDPFGSVVKSIYKGDEFKATLEALEATKKNPKINALLLYTQRAFIAQKKLGQSNFETALKQIYDTDNLDTLPENLKSRIKYLGEGLYAGGMNEGLKMVLKIFDFATTVFKKGATIANPAFGIKQIAQNPIQASLKMGLQAFKVFDPRAFVEGAAISLADNGKIGKSVPDYLANLFYKSSDNKPFAAQALDVIRNEKDINKLRNITISNPFGRSYTGEEALDLAYSTGALRSSIDDLAVVERDVLKDAAKLFAGDKSGMFNFFKESLKYWKYPEHIEKFYRTSYFINGLRSGLSPDDAAKLVDETLFNYQGSLTLFERRVMKRLAPFYSFQRNAIPLVLKSMLTEPGRVSVAAKTLPLGTNKFYEVWNKLQGGEKLSDEERYIAPGFIFQQASVFAGTDEKGKLTFNTFNNYTPFDAINLIGQDEDGKFDLNATMKKIVFASLNPYIKMSTEIPANRYFFNDRVITESAKIGNLGKYLEMVLPEGAKEALQFEAAIDPIEGVPKYYINPYLAYGIMSLPGINVLSNYARALDPEKNYKEQAMSLLLGVQTNKYDKTSLQVTKALKTKYRINELQSDYKLALKQGRSNEAERRLKELEDYFSLITKESSYKSQTE